MTSLKGFKRVLRRMTDSELTQHLISYQKQYSLSAADNGITHHKTTRWADRIEAIKAERERR